MRELRRQWIGRDLLGPLARPPRPTVIPSLPPVGRPMMKSPIAFSSPLSLLCLLGVQTEWKGATPL